MSNLPEDLWMRRMLAVWKVVMVVAAGLVGLGIVLLDVLLHWPPDLTICGIGGLFMGVVPVAAAEARFNSRSTP